MSNESGPPRPPRSPNSIVGIAKQVRQASAPHRGKPAAHQLLTLRVDVIDKDGRHTGLIGIELRGHEIRGNVEDGDWVEIADRPTSDGRIKSFWNLTTATTVSSWNAIFTA